MEFLLLWVLSGNFVDSGLRYEDAGSCYAEAHLCNTLTTLYPHTPYGPCMGGSHDV